ncbi:MAG: hypothetical protein PHQ24_09960 [Proteiniphilum sp.]|nr:hypothetical protein [Proteiniphilum sp.]
MFRGLPDVGLGIAAIDNLIQVETELVVTIIIEEQFQRIETLVTLRGITRVENRLQNGIIQEQQFVNTDIHLLESGFVRLDGITEVLDRGGWF